MKKIFCLIFCIGILAWVVAGCGQQPVSQPEYSEEPAAKAEERADAEVRTDIEEDTGTYTIIYDRDLYGKAVKACERFQEVLGEEIGLCEDQDKAGVTTPISEYEILIGATNRPESAALGDGLGLYDYRIEVHGNKLVIAGGCDDAVIGAIGHLIWDESFSLEKSIKEQYSVFFDGADSRQEYMDDPDLFLCNWAYDFQTPEWMKDYEEKLAAFFVPDGRAMSSIHRGDSINYPENSIEGIISTIHMGGDNVEMDVRRSKDGVLVLMHDDSLQRTTDWSEKKGTNGLPESASVADWTYEELLELRLKTRSGGKTDYIIPTLKEALSVCKGRITVRLDKADIWDWDTEVYPIIQEVGAYDTCWINFEFDLEKQERIMEEIRTESGKDTLLYRFVGQDKREQWKGTVDELLARGHRPMILYYVDPLSSLELFVEMAKPELEQISGDVRIYMQVHMGAGGPETHESFDFLVEHGINTFLVDNGLNLQKYIAENCAPTEAGS